jgi:hypothetical protein
MEVLGKRMDAMGVKKTDKVISVSDPSFNASLFFLDREGWTNFIPVTDTVKIEYYKTKGAKYLVIRDNEKPNFPFLEPYMIREIGRSGDMAIYKL